jgi:inorganic pyrophosphatase
MLLLPCVMAAQAVPQPSSELPAGAVATLGRSLAAAVAHPQHIWRDTPPLNDDDRTANAYVEIARGDRRKWEFDMGGNKRAIDRVMPATVGGYPVNYGFVPQTVSYDGDPFDALVLGPALPAGGVVRGVIVGLMLMEDENGIDSKVVLSPVGADGRPLHQLSAADQQRIGRYFNRYKRHEPGKFARVPGWGSAADGLAHIKTTHAFFRDCRGAPAVACRVGP